MKSNYFRKSYVIATLALLASGCAVQEPNASATAAEKVTYSAPTQSSAQAARPSPRPKTTTSSRPAPAQKTETKKKETTTTAARPSPVTTTGLAPVDTTQRKKVAVTGASTSEVAIKLYD